MCTHPCTCMCGQGGNEKCILSHALKSLTAFSLAGGLPRSWSWAEFRVSDGIVKARDVLEFITKAEYLSLWLCKPGARKKGNLKEPRG